MSLLVASATRGASRRAGSLGCSSSAIGAQRWLGAAAGKRTLLAALVERPPQLTPDLPDWEVAESERKESLIAFHKQYPEALTAIEEGGDQERARLRMMALVEDQGSREGDGDRTGDERSLERRLAQRTYLLVRIGDEWRFPQGVWSDPEQKMRVGLSEALEASCGDELKLHPMGNAPLGHLTVEGSDSTLFVWRYLHVAGQVNLSDSIDDFAWLTKEELVERLGGAEGTLGGFAAKICGPFA